MFCSSNTNGARKSAAVLTSFFLAVNCYAIPTWIGVTSGTSRQTGGNPGTFTILMNQYYSTLHASVFISVNAGNYKEYAMSYDGTVSKNSKWTYTPAAVFPAAATIKYYFRGWDDAGGNIFDGGVTASYSFVSIAPAVVPVAGDVDLYGSLITMGSMLDDLNRPVFYLSASDAGSISTVRFGATRQANDWIWERGSAAAPMMKLDALNRLTLFDPVTIGNSTIVLDPSNPQPGIFVGGQRVLTTTSATTSFLPLNPMQLAVGVNNSVGADSLAVGSSAQATGHNAIAFGSNTSASGENAFALGDHTRAQGYGQFVIGSYNTPQGSPNAAAIDDQLFVIGNGTDDSHRSNALTVLRNGRVGIGTASPAARLDVQGDANVNGNVKINGAISIAPQGDLSMGEFTQGQAP
jgi:hypothetical protein